MDGFTIPPRPSGDLFGRVPDRSPADVPPAEQRGLLTTMALQFRFASVGHPRGMEIVALADVLEALAAGETEAACEALREAEALRRMRA